MVDSDRRWKADLTRMTVRRVRCDQTTGFDEDAHPISDDVHYDAADDAWDAVRRAAVSMHERATHRAARIARIADAAERDVTAAALAIVTADQRRSAWTRQRERSRCLDKLPRNDAPIHGAYRLRILRDMQKEGEDGTHRLSAGAEYLVYVSPTLGTCAQMDDGTLVALQPGDFEIVET